MRYIVDYTYWSPGGNKLPHSTQTFDFPRKPTIRELMRIFDRWGQRVERIHSVTEEAKREESD
jgi:hypothetical protein